MLVGSFGPIGEGRKAMRHIGLGLLVGSLCVSTMAGFDIVAIDIKPGSDPNCFNNNGNGVIPVAILGSSEFDVTQVDAGSVILEGLGVRSVGRSNKLLAHIEDTSDDGFDDLVIQIEDVDGAFEVGDTTATLSGTTLDGTAFEGSDSICITQ